ncbi:hypothetical protein I7I48_05567 [Histoplasma ohiense]|nr:hypothetical protein I7I48_05567 [Histoplasma ohiense (nom. inval.)]
MKASLGSQTMPSLSLDGLHCHDETTRAKSRACTPSTWLPSSSHNLPKMFLGWKGVFWSAFIQRMTRWAYAA